MRALVALALLLAACGGRVVYTAEDGGTVWDTVDDEPDAAPCIGHQVRPQVAPECSAR